MKARVGERRGAPRMPAAWTLRARRLGQDTPEEEWLSANASSGGLGVEAPGALRRDDVVKLSFSPGGQASIQAYAFVAWSRSAQGRAGLRFIGISEEEQERLGELVQRFLHGDPLLRDECTGRPTYRSRLFLRALFAD